jgi:polyphosphate kinase
MNSLVDPAIIDQLYAASRAGVDVDLVIRGICCLRPGVPGLSENISVKSIVGRFLEHSRIWCFGNGADGIVYLSSADWMERNFFRRVEIAFPVMSPALSAQLRADLQLYLEDTREAWQMNADGLYARVSPAPGSAPLSAQATLLERFTGVS